MIGIYCTTIYHLMVAISLAQNDFKNQEIILFISPHFIDKERVVNNLSSYPEEDLFKEIVILNDYFGSKRYAIERKFRFIFFYPKAIELCQKYLFKKFIFFPGNLTIASLFAKYISKNNPCCEFAFGDDGLASYINHDEYTKLSNNQKHISKLLNYDQYLRLYKTLYVMEPSLVISNKRFILKQISHPNFGDSKFQKVIKEIFLTEVIPACDILYLQQPFIFDSRKFMRFENIQDRSYKVICDACTDKKIYIKIHPRTPRSYVIPSHMIKVKSTGLFEASLTSSINQTMLITLFSTAAFTPFMFWGYTPTIILLYHMANKSILSDNLNEFLRRFKVVYSQHGGKIYEPRDWNQLISLLKLR